MRTLVVALTFAAVCLAMPGRTAAAGLPRGKPVHVQPRLPVGQMPGWREQALPGAGAPPGRRTLQVQRTVRLGQVPRRRQQALSGRLIAGNRSRTEANRPAPVTRSACMHAGSARHLRSILMSWTLMRS